MYAAGESARNKKKASSKTHIHGTVRLDLKIEFGGAHIAPNLNSRKLLVSLSKQCSHTLKVEVYGIFGVNVCVIKLPDV